MTWVLLLVALAQSPEPPSGWLRIESQPGVEVVWEGVSLGRTDASGLLLVEEIPIGRFEIVLRGRGLETAREAVDITPGRNAWTKLLETVAPAPPPPPVAEVESREPAAPVPAPPPQPEPQPAAEPDPPGQPTATPAPMATDDAAPLPSSAGPVEAESDDTTPATARGPSATTWIAAIAILGAAGAAAYAWRLRALAPRRAPPPAPRRPSTEPELDPEPVARPEKSVNDDFLDQLRRREQQLDGPGRSAPRRPDKDDTGVIDVEFREVVDRVEEPRE